jgi:hypothetical protein
MADLRRTVAHSMEHVGQVVTLPALLEQRRAERAEHRRRAGETIMGTHAGLAKSG